MRTSRFILNTVAANAYPLADDSQSIVLTAIHLPLALTQLQANAFITLDGQLADVVKDRVSVAPLEALY